MIRRTTLIITAVAFGLIAGNALAQHGDQTGVDGLGEDEKGRTVQTIDPVIGCAPQAEPLARHVAPWQIGEATVIDAHMAVSVEQAHALAVEAGHPFLGQTTLPLGRLTVLAAELRDFSPQGFDFR